MTTVIRVENLSKKYIIGTNGAGSDGLRHAIHDFFAAPVQLLRAKSHAPRANGSGLTSDPRPLTSDFWALKDISFDVKQGEVVGIIGRNGAGKSTLLKILSRITEPTTGRLGIRGRVASLLEVGTGFHPELTGRENVFLNGAILGMTREEIKRKFDEIVAFAEVEQFIDTPVKRYSSGMYVRLAFAVAAHLEPEILIIDEVLAVGDAQFQKKCLGKMKNVSHEGRTVLFVSHQMSAISQLCSRVVLLNEGRAIADGLPRTVLSIYLQDGMTTNLSWKPESNRENPFRYDCVKVSMSNGDESSGVVHQDSDISIDFEYEVRGALPPGRLAFYLTNAERQIVLSSASTDGGDSLNQAWVRGKHFMKCKIPRHLLSPGRYYLTISEPTESNSDIIHENIISFDVSELNSLGARDGRAGVVMPMFQWHDTGVTEAEERQ